MRFSQTTQAFYPEELKYPVLPPDLITVSDEDYQVAIARAQNTRIQVVGGRLVIEDLPPPPKTREQRITEIDAQRDATFAAGLTFNDQLYHTDALFQSQLQAFVLAWQVGVLAPTATVAIRLKDNKTVQMTRAEVTALAAALMQFVQDTYAASWAAKDSLPLT